MRRILSAAAALVLAFGITLVGATVANATGPFTADDPSMPGYAYAGQTITVGGNLPGNDAFTGLDIADAGTEEQVAALSTSGTSCYSTDDISTDDRTWSCTFTVPASGLTNGGLYNLVSNFNDSDDVAQTTTDSFTYYDVSAPTLTITSGTAGTTATVTSTATLAGATSGEVDTYVQPSDGDPVGTGSCDFGDGTTSCTTTVSGSGLRSAIARQDYTNPEKSQFTAPIYFTIPEAPEVLSGSYNSATGFVTVSGEGTPGDDVVAIDDTGKDTCSATVDGEGDWICTTSTAFVGLATFSAYQIDRQTTDPNVPDGSSYQSGTYSALSAGDEGGSVDVFDGRVLPAMQYTYIPGGVVVSAAPTGSATKALTKLYKWYPAGGSGCDGNVQANSGFDVCDYCPTVAFDGEGTSFENVPDGTSTCTWENLAPGVWNPSSEQNTAFSEGDDDEGEGGDENWTDDYFVIPTAPAVTKAVNNANGKATISGTGIPGDVVHVVADGTSGDVCTATVAGNGTWKCSTGVLPNGSTTFRAYQEDAGAGRSAGAEADDGDLVYHAGGLSAVTANGAVAVITRGSPSPAATTPPPWTFNLSGIDLGNIHPGDTFTITATGLPAGATITTVIHSTPVTLGVGTVASDGTFSQTITIPSDIDPGAHQLILTMDGTGLATSTSTQAVTVLGASSTTGGSASNGPSDDPSNTPGTARHEAVDESSPTAPNILTRSINTIQDVIAHPQKISAAVAIGLVLLVFATIPARLLNATVAEQYENIVKRIPRLGRRPKWWERFTAWLKSTPLAGGIALTAVTALLFGFADPHFGFNLASLRLIMGLAIALFIVEYLANVITGAILKRRMSLGVVLNLRPLGLILTLVGVVASRLLHFSPGFLIGLVLGLTLTGRTAAQNAWKAVMIRSGVVVGLGVVAWIGYSALTTGDEKTETFWTELFVEVLVAITTEGIVAILVELLPFRLLEGERLWHKSRWLWAAAYFVVLVAFIVAVVPWEGNWEAFGSSLWIWITAVAVFFAICVGLYLYFRFASPFRESEEEHEKDPVEVGGGG